MTKCAPKSPTAGSLRHFSAPLAIAFALAVTSVAQPTAGRPVQQPIEGWPMAKWGMTEPEVLKAFGSAARTQTEKVANRQSSDETSTVGIDDVAVGGVSFRVFRIRFRGRTGNDSSGTARFKFSTVAPV
jgi:hypothetical protein